MSPFQSTNTTIEGEHFWETYALVIDWWTI